MHPLHHDRLSLMSFGWLRSRDGSPIWSAEAEVDPRGAGSAAALAVQLLHTTRWGELDFLVIDTPPGTGQIPMALAARGHLAGAVVVTTPSKLAVADVVRGVAMLSRFDIPILAVVENMASFRCGSCGTVHFPYGRRHLEDILSSISTTSFDAARDGNTCLATPAFSLPIVPFDDRLPTTSNFTSEVNALARSLEISTANMASVELPQLAWHERPSWTDKLYFAKARRHASRRQSSDMRFKISPPKMGDGFVG
eukprot:SAG31_NODE_192_length_20788_cov_8.938083_7_plen_253_part_00